MALFLFTKNILAGKPIEVFNDGHHQRDFTYIDDIVEGVVAARGSDGGSRIPNWDSAAPDPATSSAPYRIYNIGNQRPVELLRYIEVLEQCLGQAGAEEFAARCSPAIYRIPGPMSRRWRATWDIGPRTDLETGVKRFVEWYLEYYHPQSCRAIPP